MNATTNTIIHLALINTLGNHKGMVINIPKSKRLDGGKYVIYINSEKFHIIKIDDKENFYHGQILNINSINNDKNVTTLEGTEYE